MNTPHCPACDGEQFTTVYKGPIRSGSPGKVTKEDYEVMVCGQCSLRRLRDIVPVDYESGAYREDYNDSAAVKDYLRLHATEQPQRLERIGPDRIRDRRVLDYGCGGGAFLDIVRDMAQSTHGIEPMTGFHDSLRERGHQVVGADNDPALVDGIADVVVSFGVIEHVADPLAHLRNIHRFLAPGGVAFVETDNAEEILMRAALPEFGQFFYRTAHTWYFTGDTLAALCHKAGFADVRSGYRHGYGLSNFIRWLRDREPTGFERLPWVDDDLDRHWQTALENAGMADLILFELSRN